MSCFRLKKMSVFYVHTFNFFVYLLPPFIQRAGKVSVEVHRRPGFSLHHHFSGLLNGARIYLHNRHRVHKVKKPARHIGRVLVVDHRHGNVAGRLAGAEHEETELQRRQKAVENGDQNGATQADAVLGEQRVEAEKVEERRSFAHDWVKIWLRRRRRFAVDNRRIGNEVVVDLRRFVVDQL